MTNASLHSQTRRARRTRFLLFLLGLIVVAGLTIPGLIFPMVEVSTPIVATVVPLQRLVLREGRLCRASDARSFSGVTVEFYPNGSLKARSTVVRGMLHGVSEGWHTNQVLQVREHFVHGFSQGTRVKWRSDGVKESEATLVGGRLEGIFRRWNENGELAEQIEMKHGLPDGVSLAYYPSGSLRAEAHLESGKVTEQRFWKDGERKPDGPYPCRELVSQPF